jgi:hypothetical protein
LNPMIKHHATRVHNARSKKRTVAHMIHRLSPGGSARSKKSNSPTGN